jgi:hypothetical protein
VSKILADRVVRVASKTPTWSTLTGLVVILLVFDGIITSLPLYDLQSHSSFRIHLFFGIEVSICAIAQVIYLRMIKRRLGQTVGQFRKYAEITYYLVSVTQCLIVVLLLVTFVEIESLGEYHTNLVLISVLLGLSLSVGVSGLLAFRFLRWIKYKEEYLIIAYTAAAVLICINAIWIALFMFLEMQDKPLVIIPSFIYSNVEFTSYYIHYIQSNLSFASFVALWIASTLLLRRYRKKWGALKFYTIISFPLVYYLGVLQLAASNVLVQSHVLSSFNIYTFNVINSILTKPVGGALFGVAFWMVGKSISDKKIREYMELSAIGIMLLSISNEDAGLYLLPYPPFGFPTITFVGISSYMLFVGIYYASISISMNTELRKTIESSVEEQFKFVSKIGKSQMESEIESRVKGIAKKSAKLLEENIGVEAQVEDRDIEEYIKLVVKEKEKMLKGSFHTEDENSNHVASR